MENDIPKFKYNYITKDKNGDIGVHTNLPVIEDDKWHSTGSSKILVSFNESDWNNSLHKIDDSFNLTKIGSSVLLIIDGDTECYVSKESADEIKEFIKSKALK